MAEQWPFKPLVEGSSPSGPTYMSIDNRLPLSEMVDGDKRRAKYNLFTLYDKTAKQILENTIDLPMPITGDVSSFRLAYIQKGPPKIYFPEPDYDMMAVYFLWSTLNPNPLAWLDESLMLKTFRIRFQPDAIKVRDGGFKKMPYAHYFGARLPI